MDYHVLILSRIREGHERGLPHKRAVAEGITTTAGVITSAAMVMVAVFAIFATLSEIDFKQLGVALASAVLIDATVVRIVLLPSVMKLLGRWNWYLPSWLGFLARPQRSQLFLKLLRKRQRHDDRRNQLGLPLCSGSELRNQRPKLRPPGWGLMK